MTPMRESAPDCQPILSLSLSLRVVDLLLHACWSRVKNASRYYPSLVERCGFLVNSLVFQLQSAGPAQVHERGDDERTDPAGDPRGI